MAQSPTTARIRQRRRQRLILVLLLMVGLLAAAGYFLLKPSSAKKGPQPRPPGTVAVPYARANIGIGAKVNFNMVGVRYMPPHEVPFDAILTYNHLNGRIATRRIEAGGYFRESDFAPTGAPSSFSGIARPGYRIVVVPSSNIITPGYLREGDMVDILALSAGAGGRRGGAANRPAATTIEGGGTQPGASGQNVNRRANTGITAGAVGASATLIAENAKVIVPPTPQRGRRNPENAVFEMLPQDAHVTMLALGSGQRLQLVFRHFQDEERITPAKPITDTTYLPRSSSAPGTVTFITGSRIATSPIRDLEKEENSED